MDDARRRGLAWAKFTALRNNLPRTWDETAVSDFHQILVGLQEAFGEDLSAFRITQDRMKPVPVNVQRQPRSGRPVPPPLMSQARYCSVQFALQQVEGVYSYLEHLESQMSRSPEPEPTALTDAQRNRLVSAEEKLRDAVRSRQQMKDLKYPSDWVRAGLHNGPSPSEEMVGLLSLELDVRTYVVEEINTLAEAAWSIRPLDGFAERVNKCAAEAVDHGLGFVNTADRNCMNRTLLEDAAAGVAYHWTEKARTAFPPLWGQSPGKTGQTGSDLNVTIRVQREGEGESQREPHPFYEYPKWKYHWNREATVVKSLEEEKALGVGWADSPAAFDPYKGARPARTEGQDPVKWVDEWSVPGLLPDHRKRIKAQLLRADGAFERSPDPGCRSEVHAARF